jgi:hypothetical protein
MVLRWFPEIQITHAHIQSTHATQQTNTQTFCVEAFEAVVLAQRCLCLREQEKLILPRRQQKDLPRALLLKKKKEET